jgi:hypothetical protein
MAPDQPGVEPMSKIIASLALTAVLVGCDTLDIGGTTEVRVENGSPLTFDAVSYWAGGNEVSHGALASGDSTPYVEANGAYGYTTTQVVVGADTVRLQVIDYVGETPLVSGRYSYVLRIEGQPGSRTLLQELRHDP